MRAAAEPLEQVLANVLMLCPTGNLVDCLFFYVLFSCSCYCAIKPVVGGESFLAAQNRSALRLLGCRICNRAGERIAGTLSGERLYLRQPSAWFRIIQGRFQCVYLVCFISSNLSYLV